MIKVNSALCKNTNNISLFLLYYGRAIVGKEWKGSATNPIHSRLFYIVNGSATINFGNNKTIVLESGKWYLLPAGCSFSFSCENTLDHIYFHFKLCDFDGVDFFNNCAEPCSLVYTEDKTQFFIDNLDNNKIIDGLKVRQAVYDILLSIIDKNNIKIEQRKLSPCVSSAIKYIKQNLSIQLKVNKIAESIFVSKSTITKHFNKELSISVHSYICDMILFEASQLLSKNKLSIMEISEKLGFSDQFYFSRLFTQKFGMPPREYRKLTI